MTNLIRIPLIAISIFAIFVGTTNVLCGQTPNDETKKPTTTKTESNSDDSDDAQKSEKQETAKQKTLVKKVTTDEPTDETTDALVSTHEQSETFTPQIDGQDAKLSTFRVRPDGYLVACVTPSQKPSQKPKENPAEEPVSLAAEDVVSYAGYLQIYTPEFELSKQIGLPFAPTAIDLDAEGNMFVGGGGSIYKLDIDGEILKTGNSPHLVGVDLETRKQEALEQARAKSERTAKSMNKLIKRVEEELEELADIDQEDRTKTQIQQIKRLENRQQSYRKIIEKSRNIDEKSVIRNLDRQASFTAIAVTPNDIFVSLRASQGSGYEVYRLNHDFDEAKRILKGLRGCCGQMDIHAQGDKVYVAQNCKFSVSVHDRDGKALISFGEKLKGKNQGFGGCCNPMNVLCCPDGNVLTAESSLGKIKRFNSDGEMTAYVGKAKLAGGCKHVAIGFDEERNRIYVQSAAKNQIAVLTEKE